MLPLIHDPTKIIVSVKDLGITGHQAEVWLREQYNIEVELSDHTTYYVLSLWEIQKVIQIHLLQLYTI